MDMTQRLRAKLYGDPYESLPAGPEKQIFGWNSLHPFFHQIIDRVKPRAILEIGTWMGASAIHMSALATEAEIVCVDTWLGAEEFMNPPGDPERDMGIANGYPTVYFDFLRNMVRVGIQDRVTPIPQTSSIACRWLRKHGFRFDLIYIDGSHETQDVKDDIQSALSVLADGGAIFGDDATHPPVMAAIAEIQHTVHGCKWEMTL